VLFTTGLAVGVLRSRSPIFRRRRDAVDGGDAAAAAGRRDAAPRAVVLRAFDALPENDGHVVIAASAASARSSPASWPPSASPSRRSIPTRAGGCRAQVRRAHLLWYASRPEILDAAQTGRRAFVLAIDDRRGLAQDGAGWCGSATHVPIYAAPATAGIPTS
jgi:hypothetical protein